MLILLIMIIEQCTGVSSFDIYTARRDYLGEISFSIASRGISKQYFF